MSNLNLITFIIPSVGRPTLINSIQCLKNQTNPNWNAIIIFDGISPTIENDDPRIMIMETEKLGQGYNSAGLVRNKAIEYATSEWIAFLDDDDSISDDYVETFIIEINKYSPDVILFRMAFAFKMEFANDYVVPPLQSIRGDIRAGHVGISFALKRQIFNDGYIFIPSHYEDWILFEKLISNSYKVMISPHVKYFVRQDPIIFELGTRIFINMKDITEIIVNGHNSRKCWLK